MTCPRTILIETLFNHHLAISGRSGCGKSNYVADLLPTLQGKIEILDRTAPNAYWGDYPVANSFDAILYRIKSLPDEIEKRMDLYSKGFKLDQLNIVVDELDSIIHRIELRSFKKQVATCLFSGDKASVKLILVSQEQYSHRLMKTGILL